MPPNRYGPRRIAMKVRYQVVFAALFTLMLPLTISAQEFRGTISGAVTDATGGTVAGAKITVTETRTNTRIENRNRTHRPVHGALPAPWRLRGVCQDGGLQGICPEGYSRGRRRAPGDRHPTGRWGRHRVGGIPPRRLRTCR